MAYSMTAYATQNIPLPGAIAHWEIRSVNHRYLELSFKLPSLLGDLEYYLRDLVRKNLSRGKIDCFLKLEPTKITSTQLIVDFNLIDQLVATSQKVMERLPLSTSISLFDILRWPSVIRMPENDLSKLNEPLQQSFMLTLQDLIKTRAREGLQLKTCIQERLIKMHERLNEIKKRLPEIQKACRLRFYEKFNELKLELDNDRIEQSTIHLMQKMDVSEELDRLMTHLTEVERILTKEKTMGRRLDFLMQELNREANTLASKAIDHATIQDSIALKVLIEEMREQIQNLE